MHEKSILQKVVAAESGRVRINLSECHDSGTLVLRFGESYTLRLPAGEMAAVLRDMSKTAAAAAGDVTGLGVSQR